MKKVTVLDKLMSSFGFKLMSLMFKVRDFFRPRLDVLNEAGIESGLSILDYGCGSGSYIVPLAELVGPSGKIYALDIHPLAIKQVKKIAAREGIENIETIQSDCETGLSNSSVDVVLSPMWQWVHFTPKSLQICIIVGIITAGFVYLVRAKAKEAKRTALLSRSTYLFIFNPSND
jgi:23S rRNA U2552 (ribose-2'-O)-methylase RlmE/FtsJ